MSTQHYNRRELLSRLATLPVIGGGVTLIGTPAGSAEPLPEMLLWEYSTWIERERRRIGAVFGDMTGQAHNVQLCHSSAYAWYQCEKGAPREELRSRVMTRGAAVLNAVGVDWREGEKQPLPWERL
ncbi:hypothetical protein LRS73_18080 [Methylobacterium currus]|uniref:hypothetical protein n=1 Tax=Methylobacterium currus TaxID=2051553 RepID=UPI001E4E50A4|nr:hypothetical protein [Methylobacterium currus]UHC14457.1 hypothetical protein LRS73_18080 [Methylobacterium currus]